MSIVSNNNFDKLPVSITPYLENNIAFTNSEGYADFSNLKI